MCGAITVASFSRPLVRRLETKWPGIPETGFKVGVAKGLALVKNIGNPRNPLEQEPVWAGTPVNYAAKCAQSADRHQIVLAGSAWDAIENNDLLVYSCTHLLNYSAPHWADWTIPALGDDERFGRVSAMPPPVWCPVCGTDTCSAILAGEKHRSTVSESGRSHAKARAMSTPGAREAQTRRRIEARTRQLDTLDQQTKWINSGGLLR